jgi:Tol biopolymer transport system component
VFETNFPFHALFSAARDRPRLVYLEGTGDALQTELVWFDRQGEILERTGIVGDLYNPRLSRDARRLLLDVSTYETEGDIWYFDLARGSSRRLTDHSIDESLPQWSPDEQTVFFFRVPDLYRIDLGGRGDPVLLFQNENPKRTSHVSVEGIVVFEETTDKRGDIGYYDPESGAATTWLASAADELRAEFSPDGKWLAYQSDESGRPEIYIDRFPERGERFRVSSEGGFAPSWSADGREIFFVSAADELVAVPVDLESGGRPVGEPQVLFRTRFRYEMYDPHPNGESFLVVSPLDPEIDRAVLVDGWVRE